MGFFGVNKHTSSLQSGPYNLFQQNGSANWSVRFSIRGQGQIRKSLGTKDRQLAEKLAQRVYYESLLKAESGLNVRTTSIAKIIHEYVKHIEKRGEQGLMSPNVVNQTKAILTRYVCGFFGEQNPSYISTKTLEDYVTWRSDYWITGPGASETFITYDRRGKQITAPITRQKRVRPSPATLNRERAAINGFLRYCFDSQYIKSLPEIRTSKTGYTARPGFSVDEFKKFDVWCFEAISQEGIHPAVQYDRKLFYAYIHLIALTGVRPTEIKNMKWGDVIGFKLDEKGKPVTTDVTLRVHGKGKSRELIPHREVYFTIFLLWHLYKDSAGFIPAKDDPLLMHKDRTPFLCFAKQFNNALKATGLTTDYRGVKRTAYSLRHFYITEQLRNGVDAYILARNAGTSVKMLEEHYDHNSNVKYKEMLRPKRR